MSKDRGWPACGLSKGTQKAERGKDEIQDKPDAEEKREIEKRCCRQTQKCCGASAYKLENLLKRQVFRELEA